MKALDAVIMEMSISHPLFSPTQKLQEILCKNDTFDNSSHSNF